MRDHEKNYKTGNQDENLIMQRVLFHTILKTCVADQLVLMIKSRLLLLNHRYEGENYATEASAGTNPALTFAANLLSAEVLFPVKDDDVD